MSRARARLGILLVVANVGVEELVDELAKVVADGGRARVVLERAGARPSDILTSADPLVFWHEAIKAAGHGAPSGGVRALVEQVAKLHPGNEVFKRFLAPGELGRGDVRPEVLTPFPGHVRLRDPGVPSELVVIGDRSGDVVRWSYRVARANTPRFTREVAWDPALDRAALALAGADGRTLQAVGVRLGRMLLGAWGEPEHHAVMRALFDARSPSERTTPLAGAVRCRLVLDEGLEGLPWRLAAVADADGAPHWLADGGWTFEHRAPERPTQHVSLGPRCPLLLVVPGQGALRDEGTMLVQSVKESLASKWSLDEGRLGRWLSLAHGRDEVLELAKGADIVVCFGSVRPEPEPALELRRDDGVTELLPLVRLSGALAAAKVKLLVLATTGAVTWPTAARGRLPCVIVPTQAATPAEARQTVLAWLHAMLAEGLDPVQALHRPPAFGPTRRWVGMQAHADFQRWSTTASVAESDDRRAQLVLDRDELRALFIRHVDALVQDPRRVVEAFLVDGGREDRLELLGEQLWKEYRKKDRDKRVWETRRVEIELVDGQAQGALDAKQERLLMQALAIEQGSSAQRALEAEARAEGWPTRSFVYWLDFRAQLDGIDGEALAAWIRLVLRRLPTLIEGPASSRLQGVRVIATLGVVTSNRDRLRRDVAGYATALAEDSPSEQASITPLGLGAVTVEHIRRYLEDCRRCPLKLVPRVAAEIHRRTHGVFARVIALIEATEDDDGWQVFATALPVAAPMAPTKLEGRY